MQTSDMFCSTRTHTPTHTSSIRWIAPWLCCMCRSLQSLLCSVPLHPSNFCMLHKICWTSSIHLSFSLPHSLISPFHPATFSLFFLLLLQLVFYPLNKVPAFFLYVVMAVVSCACFRGCLLPVNRTNKLLTRTLWVLATAFAHRASNVLYTESIFELSVDVIDIKQKFMAPSV